MIRFVSRLPARILTLSIASGIASAQAPLVGIVREDSGGRPLQGVEVTLEGPRVQTRRDADGKYTLDAPAGAQIAVFRMLGFHEVRVRVTVKTDTVRADARLVRQVATALPAVTVAAAGRAVGLGREGFAERRAKGGGKFIDSIALRERDNRRVSDVLSELTGVRLMDFREGSVTEVRAVSPTRMGVARQPLDPKTYGRTQTPGDAACWVSVFFDGTPLYRSDRMNGGKPPDLGRDFSVASLEAVEYYRSGAEVPMQFGGGNANCGVLLLWSRR